MKRILGFIAGGKIAGFSDSKDPITKWVGLMNMAFVPRRVDLVDYEKQIVGSDSNFVRSQMRTSAYFSDYDLKIVKRSDGTFKPVAINQRSIKKLSDNDPIMMQLKGGLNRMVSKLIKKIKDLEAATKDKTIFDGFERQLTIITDNTKELYGRLFGKFFRQMQSTMSTEIKVIGNPHIKSRQVGEIEGTIAYDCKWYFTKVKHTLDSGGYICILSAISNAMIFNRTTGKLRPEANLTEVKRSADYGQELADETVTAEELYREIVKNLIPGIGKDVTSMLKIQDTVIKRTDGGAHDSANYQIQAKDFENQRKKAVSKLAKISKNWSLLTGRYGSFFNELAKKAKVDLRILQKRNIPQFYHYQPDGTTGNKSRKQYLFISIDPVNNFIGTSKTPKASTIELLRDKPHLFRFGPKENKTSSTLPGGFAKPGTEDVPGGALLDHGITEVIQLNGIKDETGAVVSSKKIKFSKKGDSGLKDFVTQVAKEIRILEVDFHKFATQIGSVGSVEKATAISMSIHEGLIGGGANLAKFEKDEAIRELLDAVIRYYGSISTRRNLTAAINVIKINARVLESSWKETGDYSSTGLAIREKRYPNTDWKKNRQKTVDTRYKTLRGLMASTLNRQEAQEGIDAAEGERDFKRALSKLSRQSTLIRNTIREKAAKATSAEQKKELSRYLERIKIRKKEANRRWLYGLTASGGSRSNKFKKDQETILKEKDRANQIDIGKIEFLGDLPQRSTPPRGGPSFGHGRKLYDHKAAVSQLFFKVKALFMKGKLEKIPVEGVGNLYNSLLQLIAKIENWIVVGQIGTSKQSFRKVNQSTASIKKKGKTNSQAIYTQKRKARLRHVKVVGMKNSEPTSNSARQEHSSTEDLRKNALQKANEYWNPSKKNGGTE